MLTHSFVIGKVVYNRFVALVPAQKIVNRPVMAVCIIHSNDRIKEDRKVWTDLHRCMCTDCGC